MSNTQISRPRQDTLKGGRKAPPPPEPDLPLADVDDATLDATQLKTMMASLKNNIFHKIDTMCTNLRSKIASVRQS